MTCHSIIAPTFNRPQHLRRAVVFAVATAGPSGEVIVVDDANDTLAGLSLSGQEFNRVRHVRNPTFLDSGGSPSRNRRAETAQGEVLFFLDDGNEIIEGYHDIL